ncbi:MAG: hypothetical protein BGP05_05510 [Rhizobiales bacterium 62-47]|nr:MAG: hypothetical protein BGP05_05510 [Rhizobiales bacterium 62-47]
MLTIVVIEHRGDELIGYDFFHHDLNEAGAGNASHARSFFQIFSLDWYDDVLDRHTVPREQNEQKFILGV